MQNRSTDFLAILCNAVLSKTKTRLLKTKTISIRRGISVKPFRVGTPLGIILFSLILTGCVAKNGQSPLETLAKVVIPEVKTTDYRYASCESIWENQEPVSQENALYWLRMMGCVDRMDADKARVEAKKIEVNDWSTSFTKNILLGSAEPTIAERRQMLDSINTYSLSFPTPIRPLLQLWREQQVQVINLADANARYKRMQQEMDAKLDRLKEDNAKLRFELNNTSRKLENLTDIERQLSSRKKNANEVEKEDEAAVAATPTDTKPASAEQNSSENKAQ
ncbi:TPA: two-component system QseEF-associated lipoprotein QseG [Providencia alcalifaciens]|nr:two-component system QseEF-associated lipoprotein QseG [Providencia alcalifaciens]